MAVARERGVEPTDLPPLGDVIDAEALDALAGAGDGANGRGSGDPTVQFSYADTEVHVQGGEVSVLDTSG